MLSFFKKDNSPLDDADLIRLYKKSKNSKYVAMLVERYSALMYGVCLKYLKNEVEAEDAFMQIFEKLLSKLKKHDVENFRSWLSVLVRNHCLELLRQKKKYLTVSLEKNLMQKESFLHPFEADDREVQFMQLEKCMEALDELQKICITLFYYQNKSYKEIAALKNQSLGKVRSFIQNGRRNLKQCMEFSKHQE